MRRRVSSSESQTKMKVILFVAGLLSSGVVGEAPYPPSGWKPSGPAFEEPMRSFPLDPRNQRPMKQQEYLPPTQPRPAQGYGTPDVDLSVQGLPTVEQQPIYQLSPVNGLQYVGPQFNNDIKNLFQELKQSQFQTQQEVYRQFDLQKQLEASQLNGENVDPTPQIPRQLIPRTTPKPAQISTTVRSTIDTTTDRGLNEGEVANDDQNKNVNDNANTSVNVERQNVQQLPVELLLSPIARLSQSQSPAQFGQFRGPITIGPFQPEISQRQVAGYDTQTHFAALPSVLAQHRLFENQGIISRAQEIQDFQYSAPQYAPQTQYQDQPQIIQAQQQGQVFQAPSFFGQQQDTSFMQGTQQQTTNQYTPQVQTYPQNMILLQSGINQPQVSGPAQVLGNDGEDKDQPQLVYQYQHGSYQPQGVLPTQNVMQTYQPQVQLQYQPEGHLQYQQTPVIPNQFYQQQFYQSQIPQQQIYQGQEGSLQSGFDVNQQGNGIGNSGKDEQDDEYQPNNDDADGTTVTAEATAFGSRTEPRNRVSSRYGAPASMAEIDRNRSQSTTEAAQEETTENSAAIAQATAVSRDSKRKSAKLRSRRPRPLFTLDQSGHLVLAQEA